jgi:3-methylcrotonyl-CoA carboxylase alpha subunit
VKLVCGDERREADLREGRSGTEAVVDGASVPVDVDPAGPATFVFKAGARREVFHCLRRGDAIHLWWRGAPYVLEEETETWRAAHRHAAGGLEAPMPGKVIAVKVAPGQEVARGDELLVVEAMKMENAVRAPRAGRVRAVSAAVGDMVAPGRVLVELE